MLRQTAQVHIESSLRESKCQPTFDSLSEGAFINNKHLIWTISTLFGLFLLQGACLQ